MATPEYPKRLKKNVDSSLWKNWQRHSLSVEIMSIASLHDNVDFCVEFWAPWKAVDMTLDPNNLDIKLWYVCTLMQNIASEVADESWR